MSQTRAPGEDRIVFFDLETGGLDPTKHPLVQFAAIAVDCKTFESLSGISLRIQFDPRTCDEEALAVIGWPDKQELWTHAKHPLDAIALICGFLDVHSTRKRVSKKTGRPFYVARAAGHNAARFDYDFLERWVKRIRPGTFLPMDVQVLDTVHLALWRGLGQDLQPESFKLEALATFLEIPQSEFHDADNDVRTTVELARRLLHYWQWPRPSGKLEFHGERPVVQEAVSEVRNIDEPSDPASPHLEDGTPF